MKRKFKLLEEKEIEVHSCKFCNNAEPEVHNPYDRMNMIGKDESFTISCEKCEYSVSSEKSINHVVTLWNLLNKQDKD